MKKLSLIFFTLFFFVLPHALYSQEYDDESDYTYDDSTNSSGDTTYTSPSEQLHVGGDPAKRAENERFDKIEREIYSIKKELELLKRNQWFSFNIDASSRLVFGAAVITKDGYNLNRNMPVSLGFDFINRIKMSMNLGQTVVSSSEVANNGTEVSVKLKFQSYRTEDLVPKGSYYTLDVTDDQGNKTQIYLPKYDNSGWTNMLFGNFQLVFEEIKVSNIAGIGLFVNYYDVKEVQKYYGVTTFADLIMLNGFYFDDVFFTDRSENYDPKRNRTIYYGFKSEKYDRYSYYDYDATATESVAVQFWNEYSLGINPTNSNGNQKPHGFSIGYEGKISQGVEPYIEFGGATKDAFDPQYFDDEQIDAGFFLEGAIHLYTKSFSFYPKLALSFAFQTDTVNDVAPDSGYSTFSSSLNVPLAFQLPTGEFDRVNLDFSWSINTHFAYPSVATMFSFFPEFVLFNNKLSISIPLVYSYKYRQGGFLSIGNENYKVLYQDAEDSLFNLGFIVNVDSRDRFGDMFQYSINNKILLAVNSVENRPEVFFYEICRNTWSFNDIGPKRLSLYFEMGYALGYDIRLISANYHYNPYTRYWYDESDNNTIVNVNTSTERWHIANILRFETGMDMLIMKNLSFGFSIESPKLFLGLNTPIDQQRYFTTIRVWSEIRL